MPMERHSWKGGSHNASCSGDEEMAPGGQGEGHSTLSHRSSEEANSPRNDSDQSGSQSSSEEEYEEADSTVPQPSNPLTTRKKLTQKRFKGLNRAGHRCQQRRSHRAPVLPPLRLLDGPGQRIASAKERHIKQLSSEVRDLQRRLSGTVQENRLLQRLQSRHATALQHFQDGQASLPQLLHNHSSEVRTLQELLRSSKTHSNTLARRLRSTESTLLHACNTLQRLQRLSQDRGLEERETLTQRLDVLTVDLEKKNKRIQDLEKNLALSNASFNRQLNAEMRKTTEAQELSRQLEELISNLMQKMKGMEKELAIHDIYSHRFPKGSFKRDVNPPPVLRGFRSLSESPERLYHCGTKESKSVQTEAASEAAIKAPTLPLQIDYPVEGYPQKELEKNINTWEFYTNDSAKGSSSEDEQMQMYSEETSNETPPDIGRTSGMDGTKMEYNAEREECAASLQASREPNSEENNDHLGFHNLVINQSPSANMADKSPVKIRHRYIFKDTILNLHSGIPAYGTSQRFRPSFPRCNKPKATPILLDTGAYDPSFFVPATTRSVKQEAQPMERPNSTKKNNLMKELFGEVKLVEKMPDAGTKSSDPNPFVIPQIPKPS